MITGSILPFVAVCTVGYDFTLGGGLVCFDNVFDDGDDLVILELWRPVQVPCCVVNTRVACMTNTLHGMPQEGTRDTGTSSEEEGVCSMAKVVGSSANLGLIFAYSIARRRRQSQPLSCHCLTRGLEADDRPAVRCPYETADRAAKGMANHPNVGIWVNLGDILIQVEGTVVVVVLLLQALGKTGRVAGITARLAVAYWGIQIGLALTTATAEEKIVIFPVAATRAGTAKEGQGCALDADDDGLVDFICEDVTSQTVGLPAKVIGIIEAMADWIPLA